MDLSASWCWISWEVFHGGYLEDNVLRLGELNKTKEDTEEE